MMTHTNNKVMILAGEASGDLWGSLLATHLKQLNPNLTIRGMGGTRMREAGVDTIVDGHALAVVGGMEIFRHFNDIRNGMKTIKRELKNNPPDVLILIDFPEFNLRFAKHAKRLGIKTLYYVSPQVWAWRRYRLKKIKRTVDHMMVLFAFEETLYKNAGVPVSFVGHPLVDIVMTSKPKHEIYVQYKLKEDKPIIALIPGSRVSEITRLLPIMMESMQQIKATLPEAQFVLPLASSLKREQLETYLNDEVTIIEDDTYNVLSVCDTAITASGTATLELALLGVPMVIVYKLNPISFSIAKRVIKVDHIGLCNIVAECRAVKEFIQNEVTPEAITEETLQLIQNQTYRKAVLANLERAQQNIGKGGSAKKAAEIALQLIDRANHPAFI